MAKKLRIFNRINTRILVALVILLSAAGIITIAFNYFNLHNTFEAFYTQKVLLSNNLMASLIDPEDIVGYVQLLSSQSESFKLRQRQFSHDRDELLRLQESNAPEAALRAVQARMQAFHDDMEQYKAPEYQDTLNQIKKLKTESGARYVYVFADTGVKDDDGSPLYTFIFDAEDNPEFRSVDSDGLGTVAHYEPIVEDIIASGKSMGTVDYYNEPPYGELYFCYAPILDSEGKTVALIGTDLALTDMKDLLSDSMLFGSLVFSCFVIFACIVIYLFLTRTVTRPLSALTNTALRLADGDVYETVPDILLDTNNELGLLAHAIDDMGAAYQGMIKSTGTLVEAANLGRLEVRNDVSRFKGDIAQLVKQINATLDATMLYLNSMPEAVFIMSQAFEVFFQNDQYTSMFGKMSAEQFFGHVFALQPPADSNELSDRLVQELSHQQGSHNVFIDERCFSVVIKEISVNSEAANSVLVIAVDITDLMTEKENAQAASRAKSEFLSRVSHELRTPMNAILGMSTLGLREERGEALEKFKMIDEASRHLLNIINDVLDMSRIEAGKTEMRVEPFDLPALLDECMLMFLEQAHEQQLTFALHLDPALPHWLNGDGQHLKQVLINLLGNAMKFTEAGGSITLTVQLLSDEAHAVNTRFVVEDTGIGMSHDFLDKLFLPFEQESAYLRRQHKGTGLGLPLCQNLVALMGGTLEVQSELGHGSTFTFDLSFDHAQGIDKSCTCEAHSVSLAGMKVLLVDDIDINRLIFIKMLEDQHIDITEASDGQQALACFENSEEGFFDLIVMDVQMPVMDGYEATRRIRALPRGDARVPIIAMTANAFKQDVDEALASGMNGHISKPIDYEACVAQMKRFYRNRD